MVVGSLIKPPTSLASLILTFIQLPSLPPFSQLFFSAVVAIAFHSTRCLLFVVHLFSLFFFLLLSCNGVSSCCLLFHSLCLLSLSSHCPLPRISPNSRSIFSSLSATMAIAFDSTISHSQHVAVSPASFLGFFSRCCCYLSFRSLYVVCCVFSTHFCCWCYFYFP